MRLRVSIELPLYTGLFVYIDNISTVSQNRTLMCMRLKHMDMGEIVFS